MTQLAGQLSRATKAKVWDKTGLAGTYDFHFRAAQDDGSFADNSSIYPRLTDVLNQEYGLQFERHIGSVETIVVDHIEKLPTDNWRD